MNILDIFLIVFWVVVGVSMLRAPQPLSKELVTLGQKIELNKNEYLLINVPNVPGKSGLLFCSITPLTEADIFLTVHYPMDRSRYNIIKTVDETAYFDLKNGDTIELKYGRVWVICDILFSKIEK